MNGVTVAPALVLGAGRMVVVQEQDGLRVAWHSTDVPKKNGDRGNDDAPSNGANGATDHVRESTGCPLALSTWYVRE